MGFDPKNAPQYTGPIPNLFYQRADRNGDLADQSDEQFEGGQFAEAFASFLKFLDPASFTGSAFNDGSQAFLSHGSVRIEITRKGDTISIRCPFVRLADKGRVAALRKCAEMNMYPLLLAQIRMFEKNDLYFFYEEEIQFCYPGKILNIFKEMASTADHHDDLFVEKFGAKALVEAKVEKPDAATLDTAFEFFTKHVDEVLAYIKFGESKSNPNFTLDMAFFGSLKLGDVTRPNGLIRSTLSELMNTLYSNVAPEIKLEKIKKQFNEYKAMSKEKFAESIYKVKSSIPFRRYFELSDVKDFLQRYQGGAIRYRKEQNADLAGTMLFAGYYILIGYYDMDSGIEKRLRKALQEVSGKSWSDTADELIETNEFILDADEDAFTDFDSLADGVQGTVEMPGMAEAQAMAAAMAQTMAQNMAQGMEAYSKMMEEAMKAMQAAQKPKKSGDDK